MKVVKIDSKKRDIYEIEMEPNLKGMYAALECETIERIPNNESLRTDKPHDLWLDEDGLFTPDTFFFAVVGKEPNTGCVYRGHGIITGLTDEGGWQDHSADIDELKKFVIFMTDPADFVDENNFDILN